jgi:tRNA(Ile)-lysidine synthase
LERLDSLAKHIYDRRLFRARMRSDGPRPSSLAEGISDRGLFRHGQAILVAVSGGVDSMVLLQVLHELSGPTRWRLAVAHLNHQLRGKASDADERLVRRFAKKLKVPVIVERAHVRRIMKQERISLEMAARQARHEFLARTARRRGIRTVALAHHTDDQIELFLLRLLRGTGAQGLSGMPWRNPSPADPRVQLTRPLLDRSKAELRCYAKEHKIPFREDATNASTDVLRNRIRHELLPLLKKHYQPAIDQVLARTIDILRTESEFVAQTAEEALDFIRNAGSAPRKTAAKSPARRTRAAAQKTKPFTPFEALPAGLQRRVLQNQLLGLGISPDFELIEKLRQSPGKRVCVPYGREGELGFCARNQQGLIQITRPAGESFNPESVELDLFSRTSAVFAGVQFRWRFLTKRGDAIQKPQTGLEIFDAELVGRRIILRHWQPGDRFHPIGMPGEVKIQDFLTNQKVPRAKRHELVLATTVKREVFWMENMRISDRFKLRKSTIRRLQWSWERL